MIKLKRDKVIFEYFCDNYELSPIEEIERISEYIMDYVDDRCSYCNYESCSLDDDCREGIVKYLLNNLL